MLHVVFVKPLVFGEVVGIHKEPSSYARGIEIAAHISKISVKLPPENAAWFWEPRTTDVFSDIRCDANFNQPKSGRIEIICKCVVDVFVKIAIPRIKPHRILT